MSSDEEWANDGSCFKFVLALAVVLAFVWRGRRRG